MQRADVVAGVAVAAGGAVGATARYGLAAAGPWQPPGFPWATLAENLIGCALIGATLVVLTEVVAGPPWLRPFLGPGLLGGFTTFSAFAVESVRLADSGATGVAAVYVAVSVVVGLLLVRSATVTTRWAVVGRGQPRVPRPPRAAPRREEDQ